MAMVIVTTGEAGLLFMGGILGCGISFVNPAQAGKFAPWRCEKTACIVQLNFQQANGGRPEGTHLHLRQVQVSG